MSRENNREMMPIVAALVDDFRAIFGDVKVTYAKENGYELGSPDKEHLLSLADIAIPISDNGNQK